MLRHVLHHRLLPDEGWHTAGKRHALKVERVMARCAAKRLHVRVLEGHWRWVRTVLRSCDVVYQPLVLMLRWRDDGWWQHVQGEDTSHRRGEVHRQSRRGKFLRPELVWTEAWGLAWKERLSKDLSPSGLASEMSDWVGKVLAFFHMRASSSALVEPAQRRKEEEGKEQRRKDDILSTGQLVDNWVFDALPLARFQLLVDNKILAEVLEGRARAFQPCVRQCSDVVVDRLVSLTLALWAARAPAADLVEWIPRELNAAADSACSTARSSKLRGRWWRSGGWRGLVAPTRAWSDASLMPDSGAWGAAALLERWTSNGWLLCGVAADWGHDNGGSSLKVEAKAASLSADLLCGLPALDCEGIAWQKLSALEPSRLFNDVMGALRAELVAEL